MRSHSHPPSRRRRRCCWRCARRARRSIAPAAAPIEGPRSCRWSLALLLVLGLIGAAVWVLRRSGIAPRAGRQRAAHRHRSWRWVRANASSSSKPATAGSLLGVGPGGITRLGTLPKGEAAGGRRAAAQLRRACSAKLRGGERRAVKQRRALPARGAGRRAAAVAAPALAQASAPTGPITLRPCRAPAAARSTRCRCRRCCSSPRWASCRRCCC